MLFCVCLQLMEIMEASRHWITVRSTLLITSILFVISAALSTDIDPVNFGSGEALFNVHSSFIIYSKLRVLIH